jgi:MFS family permease
MGSSVSGLGVAGSNDPQAVYKLQLTATLAKIKPSASWFDWIAILSVVNGVIALGNGSWNFLLGLGVTTMLNEYARTGRISATVSLAVTVGAAAFFWLMGRFAKMGQKWALILGMLLYALDGAILLLLPVQPWLMIGFHVFALIMIGRALGAINAFEAIKADAQAHGVFLDQ